MHPQDVEFIRQLLAREAGVVLDHGRAMLIESRLLPVARHEGCPSLEALVQLLRRTPESSLVHRVVTAMTESETSFFRDVEPFVALHHEVLPRLVSARGQERSLTIWCGAASNGQEPYSIAMLLRDKFPQLQDWRIRIIASDVSPDAVARARMGRYSQFDVNRGLPSSYLVRFFRQVGGEWEVDESVRAMVEFVEINLHGDWPALPPCDVVFLRNVLTYFDGGARSRVLARVRALLRPDGYLFLGSQETARPEDEPFACEPLGRTAVYRPIGSAA